MQVIKGDLIQLALAKRFDVIIHGCNCHCEMGAGIARVIKKSFPAKKLAIPKSGLVWQAATGKSFPKSLTKRWQVKITRW